MKNWTKQEIEFLINNWSSAQKEFIKVQIKREWSAISQKALKLGLNREKLVQSDFEKRLNELNIKCAEPYNHNVHIKMNFQCRCGNEFKAKPGHIFSGHTKSCGCVQRTIGQGNGKRYNDISYAYFNRLSRGAKIRNHEFQLTIEYIWDLFIQQNKRCAYTNQKLEFSNSICTKPENQTASLDRIDSKHGYIIGNVQWVHKDINKMKQGMGDREFIEMCKTITKHRG